MKIDIKCTNTPISREWVLNQYHRGMGSHGDTLQIVRICVFPAPEQRTNAGYVCDIESEDRSGDSHSVNLVNALCEIAVPIAIERLHSKVARRQRLAALQRHSRAFDYRNDQRIIDAA